MLFGFSSLLLRGTETLRFGERSRTTAQSDLGESTSSLLSPFGSRGCGGSARTGAAGEARREVGSERGLVPGNLVRRPFPLPRASMYASSSSLDDDEKRAGRFDEGRGPFVPPLRSSIGQDAAGAAAAFPPAAHSRAITYYPVVVTVRVGLADGEKESVSPVMETASVIVTEATADNLWFRVNGDEVRARSEGASSEGQSSVVMKTLLSTEAPRASSHSYTWLTT